MPGMRAAPESLKKPAGRPLPPRLQLQTWLVLASHGSAWVPDFLVLRTQGKAGRRRGLAEWYLLRFHGRGHPAPGFQPPVRGVVYAGAPISAAFGGVSLYF